MTYELVCPECRDGKCLGRPENCSEGTLDARDEWVLCECRHTTSPVRPSEPRNHPTPAPELHECDSSPSERRTAMTDLLEAVDALTRTTTTRVVQWVTDPTGKEHAKVSFVTHDPLLQQLEEAIASTIGSGGGRSMTAKWALNVLDSDALHKFSEIDSQIRDWCRIVGVAPNRHPVSNLRAWYAATLHQHWEPATTGFYVAVLRGWAGLIRGKLNPPRSLELTEACPTCGADTWTDTDGTVYRHPVRVEYREGEPDILARARALCRACERVWSGATELRSLRWDLDQADTPSTGSA